MSGTLRKFTAMAVSLALISIPAVAAASAPAAQPSPAAANAWTTLSVMSTGASTATMAAAQDDLSHSAGGVPLPVIGVWLATLGLFIYIVTRDHDSDLDFGPTPVSPD